MNNIDTKPQSQYDGSVNEILDQQKFNMNHIYLLPDLVWLYYQKYGLTTPDKLIRWLTTIYNTYYVPVSSINCGISIVN